MTRQAVTPVRTRGIASSEGWYLLRDVDSRYRDGAEDALYERVLQATDVSADSDELIAEAEGWAERYHVDPERSNIVRALSIGPGDRVLEIGAGCGAVTRYLGEVAAHVDALEPVPARARVARARCRDLDNVEVFVGEIEDVPDVEAYDVVVVVGVLEYVGKGSADPEPYQRFLTEIRRRLVPGGTLALAIENSLGVKYLAGAPEDHTNRAFDSLEGYPYGGHARTFSRLELEGLMTAAGLTPRTMAVFPDYKMTRVVMDTDAFPVAAESLVHRLPSFPSRDHLTPRVRLADEGLLWRSLVDAGLAGHTANSLLVLAGKGAEERLWPLGVAAEFYSSGRRRPYRTITRVRATDESVQFDRRLASPGTAPTAFAVAVGVEPHVAGEDLLSWAVNADDEALGSALRAWASMVEAVPDGPVPLDLVPHNLVRGPDGELSPIDQEWLSSDVTREAVIRRGILWFASRLALRSSPQRWRDLSTVGDLCVHLGSMVGLASDGSWLDEAVEVEAAVQAEVKVAPAGDVDPPRAREQAELRRMLETPLTTLPLGERAPEELVRLRVLHDHATSDLAARDDREERARAQLGRLEAELREAHADRVTSNERILELERQVGQLRRDRHEAATRLDDATIRLAEAEVRRDLAAQSERRAQAELIEHREALATIRSSRAHRSALAYYRLVERAAPAGSRRRALYSRTGRRVVTVSRRALRMVRGPAPEAYATFAVPSSDAPTVSVVIPVHGKWSVTEQCLRALAAHTGAVPFEVLVVDDASPDDTRLRLGAVTGVRLVALDENLGFVGAVNAGVEAARGDYVILLNNDTEVTAGWMEALVETGAEADVGLVGSRLVYPDGRLQEAGGIVFQDGTCWNYGRFDDPEREQYTYQREVDFCSGAAILLRRGLLTELGNLDEYFAPAYYDDVDLAFRVRRAGLRVVYEPRSVVVHHEGISHGTDATKGIKAYQEVNRKKLVQRWAAELEAHYPPVPDLVALAARRGAGPRIVVVIDHYVPRPDEDAGSVRMYGLLLTLRRLGYGVLFVPDNRERGGLWGERLARAGVEVLYGDTPLETRFAELRPAIAAVITCRVTMAWPYLFLTRKHLPGVPFVFDTIDLHHLREEREAELTGTPAASARAAATREFELALVRAADATIVVSPVERQMLEKEVPEAQVYEVPTFHEPHRVATGPDGRSEIVFVGSFAHPPNADGISWFLADVLPRVHQKVPSARVTVVGRSAPQDLVDAAPGGVTFRGWVADLGDVYERARVAIAPLRYGAGLKGKVGEAMSYGVPVIGTSVAFEGLDVVHQVNGWVADDAAGFAEGIVALLEDEELWPALSEAGRLHIERHLGTGVFEGRLTALLGGVCR